MKRIIVSAVFEFLAEAAAIEAGLSEFGSDDPLHALFTPLHGYLPFDFPEGLAGA